MIRQIAAAAIALGGLAACVPYQDGYAPYGGGQTASKHLAKANILLCGIGLPIAPVAGDLNGIRIGTQEVTRFGMKEAAMAEIARLMARVMVAGEQPEMIKPDVVAFRDQYQDMVFVR